MSTKEIIIDVIVYLGAIVPLAIMTSGVLSCNPWAVRHFCLLGGTGDSILPLLLSPLYNLPALIILGFLAIASLVIKIRKYKSSQLSLWRLLYAPLPIFIYMLLVSYSALA